MSCIDVVVFEHGALYTFDVPSLGISIYQENGDSIGDCIDAIYSEIHYLIMGDRFGHTFIPRLRFDLSGVTIILVMCEIEDHMRDKYGYEISN